MNMLILLPPSEGKNTGQSGSVKIDELSNPELNQARQQVAQALQNTCKLEDAPEILKVGERIYPELLACQTVLTQPVSPALEIYSGVLYQAACLNELSVTATAAKYVRIISALWGMVSPVDKIPSYRLSMGVDLPGIGPLAKFWHPFLHPLLAAGAGPILDCCSQAYQKAWIAKPTEELTSRVGHLQVTRGGKVVSHWAKHTRGVVTRLLLDNSDQLDSLRDLPDLTDLIDTLVSELGIGAAVLKTVKKRQIIEVSCED